MQQLRAQKLDYFKEIFLFGTGLFYCELDPALTLMDTNHPSPDLLYDLLSFSSCFPFLKSYIANAYEHPLLLSDELGLFWNVAFETVDDKICRIHVLGPTFTYSMSARQSEEALRNMNPSQRYRDAYYHTKEQIPTTPPASLLQYGIMLNYTVSGKKYETSDYHYQSFMQNQTVRPDEDTNDLEVCYNIHYAEQCALEMVEKGCLDYKNAFDALSIFSDAMPEPTAYTISRQQKNALLSFLTLVTRAAIRGGLDPKTAYFIGGYYTNNIEKATTSSDLLHLNSVMYDDFIRRVHKAKHSRKISAAILACCNYIDLHPGQKLSLKELARLTGYAEAYLSQKFKKEMHITIKQYIKNCRTEHAKVLLRSTKDNIADISDSLGFCNPSHFIDTFRKATGHTPEEYRNTLD